MEKIEKKQSKAFGKTVYLLGVTKDGIYRWLESPKWECGWYWGFGYIEEYTNNKHPHLSNDIKSHSHWNGTITGKINGMWVSHLNENPEFKKTVLTDKESWQLEELMESFYFLEKTAEVLGRGCAGIAKNLCHNVIKNPAETKRINEVVLPKIFSKIDEILKGRR